jgi:TonB family protein
VLLLFAGWVILTAAAAAPTAQQQREPQPLRPVPVIVQPLVVRQVEPEYTAAALKARVAGDVHVVAVVRPDGTVAAAEVIKSLDPQLGLDERALDAVRQWTFEPGTVDGKPVPFAVSLVLEFRIRERNAVFPEGTTNVHLVGLTPRQREPSLTVTAGVAPDAPARTMTAGPPQRTTREEFGRGAYSDKTLGLVKPKLLTSRPARYTFAAMRARLQGVVEVDVVVQPDGTVGRARVAKGLNPSLGLDDQALVAVRDWRFSPGEIDGKPVAVVTTVLVEFRLQ